ncbi:MAG: tetratricopeptide repeat protein [Myxococcales bacterium]
MNRLPAALLTVSLLFGGACTTARPVPSGSTSAAGAAYAEGQRALKEARTDEAIAAFRRAIAADREYTDAMRALVEVHFRTGRIDTIVRELEQNVAVEPNAHLARYGLGLAYFAQSAAAEQKSVEQLAKAAALRPDVAEYHFRLGVVHLEAERYPDAVASLVKARDLAPSVPRHHVPLALALSRSGDRQGAIRELKALLTLSPDRKEIDTAKAIMARLNDSFRGFPKGVEEDFQRGLLYMDKADSPQQAIVTFEEILEKFPDLAVVHSALGLCYQRIDNPGRALDSYRRALELAPDDPRNHLYLADLYASRDRFDKATESYLGAIERDPLSEHAYERLGSLALQRGDAVQAAAWLKTLVVLRPDDLAARQSLGMALLSSGSLDDAEQQFLHLLERDGKNVEALLRLGVIYGERSKREKDASVAKGHAKKAADYFETVLDLQPQNMYAARALQSLNR